MSVPDLRTIRKELGLSQKELALCLGISPRTVQSCEQGWRTLGAALEKHLLLMLIIHRRGATLRNLACWDTMQCSAELRERCKAFEWQQGHLCWFLTGNQCACMPTKDWEKKKQSCSACRYFQQLIAE